MKKINKYEYDDISWLLLRQKCSSLYTTEQNKEVNNEIIKRKLKKLSGITDEKINDNTRKLLSTLNKTFKNNMKR